VDLSSGIHWLAPMFPSSYALQRRVNFEKQKKELIALLPKKKASF